MPLVSAPEPHQEFAPAGHLPSAALVETGAISTASRASVRFGEYYRFHLEGPANGGALETRPASNCVSGETLRRKLLRISGQLQENSRF